MLLLVYQSLTKPFNPEIIHNAVPQKSRYAINIVPIVSILARSPLDLEFIIINMYTFR